MYTAIIHNIAPVPYRMHKKLAGRQAYILGFTAAFMNADETAKLTVVFVVFHLACLMIWLVLCLIFVGIFFVFMTLQSRTTAVGGVITVIFGLLSTYFAYFEFKYIYRTYLFFWKRPLQSAEERRLTGDDAAPGRD
jgi:hypothetical protein